MIDPRLKPCPFCGSTNLILEATGGAEIAGVMHQHGWIECGACGANGPNVEVHDDIPPRPYQLVIDAWNIRIPLFCIA